MTWRNYVLRTVGRDRNVDIHRKTGLTQGTISRWLSFNTNHHGPSIEAIRAFARAYDRPILEALVAAELLTKEEAEIPRADLRLVPDEAVLAEVVHRLESRANETASA